MKLSVEYPSVAFREGPAKMIEMAKAIEDAGYDEIAVFDHVVMGYPTATRPAPIYPPQMPVIEAIVLMATIAAVTERVGISTEVLVLPQRQPVLVAKQVSSLDTISGGRIRLGVGVGWQAAEFEALDEDFANRGKRTDEAIELLRTYWREERIDSFGEFYRHEAIAMEPKPPQGDRLPIWVGGTSNAALRRTGRLGDGWMGMGMKSDEATTDAMAEVRRHAEEAGRDPASIGMQLMVAPPPHDDAAKMFYGDHDAVVRRAEAQAALGADWLSINATAMFQAGARGVGPMSEQLALLHGRLREAVG